MKIAYLDCPAGASGDMFLGALLDAGASLQVMEQTIADLKLPDCQLVVKPVLKNGIHATQVKVAANEQSPTRHLADMLDMIENSTIEARVKLQAQSMFMRLAEVEAKIHNAPIETVHFHELSGVDTIVDIVCTLVALQDLGIEALHASPVPLGRGFVKTAHGLLPLPAPATLALLKGVPVVGSAFEKELVTPTGALLLSTLVQAFGSIPTMTVEAVGYGAGSRDMPIPNVLRILIGETATAQATVESLVMLESNIDNLNPEIYEYLMSRLFAAGALDVTLTAIQMKKNRPAVQLAVLCNPAQVEELQSILFGETTTLGVRRHPVERHALVREVRTVQTAFGPVMVKFAGRGAGYATAAPEYEDCRRIAAQTSKPLLEIYRAALRAADEEKRID
jgi:hypothetical protein